MRLSLMRRGYHARIKPYHFLGLPNVRDEPRRARVSSGRRRLHRGVRRLPKSYPRLLMTAAISRAISSIVKSDVLLATLSASDGL